MCVTHPVLLPCMADWRGGAKAAREAVQIGMQPGRSAFPCARSRNRGGACRHNFPHFTFASCIRQRSTLRGSGCRVQGAGRGCSVAGAPQAAAMRTASSRHQAPPRGYAGGAIPTPREPCGASGQWPNKASSALQRPYGTCAAARGQPPYRGISRQSSGLFARACGATRPKPKRVEGGVA